MATYNLPTETTINFSSGADKILVYLAQEIPIFIPLMLFSFFWIIVLGGFFLQERKTGRGDPAMWFSIGGYLTVGLSIILSLIDGLISVKIIVITISVALIGAIWFFTSRD